MANLEYYLDRERDTLCAYERESEFFAFFDKAAGVWKLFLIPFLRFRHDFFPEKISEQAAAKLCGGALPYTLYEEYIATIKENRG